MTNPVLVETLRGSAIDLRHRGAVAICDGEGALVWSVGDVDRPVFPRSAAKLLQALPLVESGAADRYGLTDRELALSCSSHSAEDGHVDLAQAMLAKAGLGEPDLECGCHWPVFSRRQLIDFACEGRSPSQLHNNCSGKHAGFLCAVCHQGMSPAGYVDAGHAIQRQVKAAQEAVTGHALDVDAGAIDGCSIPAHAFPLRSLALAFARVATGEGLGRERAAAAQRLMRACIANPWFTAGTDRFCTRVMQAGEGGIYAKTGADGVYVAALPGLGLGVALKCDDGSGNAAEIMLAAILVRLFAEDETMLARLEPLTRQVISNWNGIEVGEIRPAVIPV